MSNYIHNAVMMFNHFHSNENGITLLTPTYTNKKDKKMYCTIFHKNYYDNDETKAKKDYQKNSGMAHGCGV